MEVSPSTQTGQADTFDDLLYEAFCGIDLHAELDISGYQTFVGIMGRELQSYARVRAFDVFSGKGNLAEAFWETGIEAETFELEDSCSQDILSEEVFVEEKGFDMFVSVFLKRGINHVLCVVARMPPRSLVFLGPPCSSFVWISRSIAQRTKFNPLGNEAVQFVRTGNRIAIVVARLMLLLSTLGIDFIIEQPATSMFWLHPAIAKVCQTMSSKLVRLGFEMGSFGASSAKPTKLVGSARWILALSSFKVPRKTNRKRLAHKSEHGVVTGKNNDLKASAMYPVKFCFLVASLYAEFHLRRQVLKELVLKPLFSSRARHVDIVAMNLVFEFACE
eukprot:6491348-Amphidinium_carterae.3